jgi:hypothetical protein
LTLGSFSATYIHGAAWSAKSDPFSYGFLGNIGLDDKSKESQKDLCYQLKFEGNGIQTFNNQQTIKSMTNDGAQWELQALQFIAAFTRFRHVSLFPITH